MCQSVTIFIKTAQIVQNISKINTVSGLSTVTASLDTDQGLNI